MDNRPRLILASASEARLKTLRNAGLDPEVVVSGVDEDLETAGGVAELTARLAQLKAEAVDARIDHGSRPTLVIGCDSLLEIDGVGCGKPDAPPEAVRRWQEIRGRTATLQSGHHVILHRGTAVATCTAVASTHKARASVAGLNSLSQFHFLPIGKRQKPPSTREPPPSRQTR